MSYPNRDTQSTHRFCGIASSFPRVHFVSPLPPPSRAPAGPSRALSSPGQPSLAQTHVPGPSRPPPASSHQPDCGRETAPVIVQPVVQDYFYQTRSQRRRTRSGDYITLSQTTFIRNVPPPTLAQHCTGTAETAERRSIANRVSKRPRSTAAAKTTYHDALACSHEDLSAAHRYFCRPVIGIRSIEALPCAASSSSAQTAAHATARVRDRRGGREHRVASAIKSSFGEPGGQLGSQCGKCDMEGQSKSSGEAKRQPALMGSYPSSISPSLLIHTFCLGIFGTYPKDSMPVSSGQVVSVASLEMFFRIFNECTRKSLSNQVVVEIS
ncbi:hypothetical protein MY1884_008880 [Beauveria asiatica]